MTKEEILRKLTFDLETRGRSIETIKEYTSKTRLFQDHYDKPADQMGETEIIEYLHYLLTEKKIQQTSVNTYNSALRFLYGVTLDVVLNYKKLPRLKQTRRLPKSDGSSIGKPISCRWVISMWFSPCRRSYTSFVSITGKSCSICRSKHLPKR